jgi:hypothetical protein
VLGGADLGGIEVYVGLAWQAFKGCFDHPCHQVRMRMMMMAL